MNTAAQPDPLDDALADLEQQFRVGKPLAGSPPSPDVPRSDALGPAPSPAADSLDAALATLTSQFPATTPPEPNLDRALDDQTLQMRQQQHRAWGAAQKQKVLEQRAQAWLDELDPYSDEGLWFTEFAASYPSALVAAIEYLRSLE